jgi:hypothetical protein
MLNPQTSAIRDEHVVNHEFMTKEQLTDPFSSQGIGEVTPS